MAVWRTLGAVLVTLAATRTGGAQTCTLAETVKPGDCFQVQMDMTLAGGLDISQGGKVVTLKQTATATHTFPERILSVGAKGLPDKKIGRAHV